MPSNPAQILLLYSTLACIAYFETDEFRRQAPLLHVIPVVTLAVLTLALTMEKKPKLYTAASFLTLAEGRYMQLVSRRGVEWSCIFITISHLLYLASFISCIRKIWYRFCFPVIIYCIFLMYHCFADVYTSLPILTALIAFHIAVICCSAIAAASVWYYGSYTNNGSQADFFRLLGLLACLGCSSLFITDHFGMRINKPSCTTNILSYFGLGLLFFANERAF